MSLFDIKNKLYKKDEEVDLIKHDVSQFDARENIDTTEQKEKFAGKDAWEEKKEGFSSMQKSAFKYGAITLGAVILIVGGVVVYLKYQQSSFNQSRVSLSVNGLNQIKSGQLITYEIDYTNNNRATLENATLEISYSQDLQQENNPNFKEETQTSGSYSLGNIPGHASGKVTLNVRAYNPDGNLMYLKADLTYTPSTFNSQFSTQSQLGITITSTPIDLEVLAPTNVSNGDAVNYLITYKNTGQEDFSGVSIQVNYPDGFSFSNSNPVADESNNVWYIGDLAAGQSGKISVSGKMQGQPNRIETIAASAGTTENGKFLAYSETNVDTKITVPPLVISQTVNGQTSLNADAGDVLDYEIDYANNGGTALRNAVVTMNIASPALDYSTLRTEKGGSFDPSTNTITWKASDYPNLGDLEPGQSGAIKFSIGVKSVIPVSSANDKNFVIISKPSISSTDIQTSVASNQTVTGDELDVKLNSKLLFSMSGYFTDQTISNAGPVPPVVGQPTTYTVHWIAGNVSNDVSDAQVTATLPTNVSMTGIIKPDGADLTYNDRTNQLIWNIGKISAGTGVISPSDEVDFQVKLIPQPQQVGETADLIGPAKFSATDSFTGQNLTATSDKLTTYLPNDPTVGASSRVQQ